jgi:hypothetical protein
MFTQTQQMVGSEFGTLRYLKASKNRTANCFKGLCQIISKVLLYSLIVCKVATDCFFFIFARNRLDCDRCSFELCLLFLFTFNNRIILFSLLALLYLHIITSIRLRDDIISTYFSPYVYLNLILPLSTF